MIVVGRNPERCAATTATAARGHRAGRGADRRRPVEPGRRPPGSPRRVLERYPRIDVLLNNAGGVFNRRLESVDGIEMTWALNHLNYFLLTNLLLDRLEAERPGAGGERRVRRPQRASAASTSTTSRASAATAPMRAYCQSKLANVLFTFELARRLEGTGVTANCVHPGFVNSSFFKDKGAWPRSSSSWRPGSSR